MNNIQTCVDVMLLMLAGIVPVLIISGIITKQMVKGVKANG